MNEVLLCSGNEWRASWDRFVEGNPASSLCHLSCWQRIVARTYGHETFYLKHCRGDEMLGVLPLIWLKRIAFGNILCSMPFLDYGGICASGDASAEVLHDKAISLRDACKAHYLELRHKEASQQEGILRRDKVDMVLDLTPGSSVLWNSLGPKVRNQVRKATKSGLTTRIGGTEYLEHFYRVFAVNMRDLGSPVHSPAFFANIFKEFGDRARTILVCDGEKAIGALISLFYRNSIFVPWASSLREYFFKCPNNLLYWDTIQYACERGCIRFHFGRSSVDSGTYKFKQQWGASESQLNWQYYYRQPSSAHIPPSEDPRFRLVSKIWRRLPLSLTTLLGPHLRKYLSN